MSKILAISMRSTQTQNELRDSLAIDWWKFLALALPDFTCVPIPNYTSNVEKLFNVISFSGIVLSGGDSLGTYQERDDVEDFLIAYAVKYKIPLLGICRGAQKIIDYFHGDLICVNPNEHVAKKHTILWNTKVMQEKLFCAEGVLPNCVNSYHNYGISLEMINEKIHDIIVLATHQSNQETNKSTVEAFCHKIHRIYGLMWHPERENTPLNFDKQIFNIIFGEKNASI